MLVITFWEFLIFDEIFLSPQVKRFLIISNKHGIYELPHELSNELRLTTYDTNGFQKNTKIEKHFCQNNRSSYEVLI